MRNWRTACGALLAASVLLGGTATPVEAWGWYPDFRVPFPCGETWTGYTRADHPTNSRTSFALDFNRTPGAGTDGDFGDPVTASLGGTAETRYDSARGNFVVIWHANGWVTVYEHLSQFAISGGAAVVTGQVIGYVGNTGASEGAHLHYEQRSLPQTLSGSRDFEDAVLQNIAFGGQPITYSFSYPGYPYTSQCATPPPATFPSDVPTTHPFYTEIMWAIDQGITTGYSDGSFRPASPVNRDAMAAFLYRAKGSPAYTPPAVSPFTDVATSHPFYKEITWLKAMGITTGYADRTFRPGDPVSREAMAAFLYRAAGSPAYTPPAVSPFSDVSTTQTFYKEIAWLRAKGVTTGYPDNTFRPAETVSRDAMAAFLYRAAH